MTENPRNVIISIKPEYALKIIAGEKTVELRRRFPVSQVRGGIALIYASSPIQKIIGYAVIDEVCSLPIDLLWEATHQKACVSKEFFYSYFDGLEKGFGLTLSRPVTLVKPVDIRQLEDEFMLSVPQSFRYAPESILNSLAA